MDKTIYRQLQEKLDLYSVGFPATKSGIEIRILEYLFSEEDAKLFLSMSHSLNSPDKIAQEIDQPVEQVAEQLDQMAEKGLLFRIKKAKGSRYGTIPFVHGVFEFQVNNIDRELAEMLSVYFDEAFDSAMQKSGEYFLRTIPVNESIELSQNVAAFDDAVEILKSKPKIVVTNCVCRERTEILDESCGKSLEACFMFGSMGQYYLDRNVGRLVTVDEAIEILKKCHEEGLVTQPATSQNPSGMCNCCGDCCGVLKALSKDSKPAERVFSNYLAWVDEDDCSGCEDCLDRCQMAAIQITDDEVARVDKDRCIGCGLCVTTCATEAMKLQLKKGEYRLPPTNTAEQMMLMSEKRGLL